LACGFNSKVILCRRCRPTGGFALVGGDANLVFYGGGGGGIDLGSGEMMLLLLLLQLRIGGFCLIATIGRC
jgi:hypothetical protein